MFIALVEVKMRLTNIYFFLAIFCVVKYIQEDDGIMDRIEKMNSFMIIIIKKHPLRL